MSSHEPFALSDRATRESREARQLAPHAMKAVDSRGRAHPESPDPHRTIFERDRDRITHATAFRRLQYKTQVFLNDEGDHHRTRLSHSLEVCQVARSVAGVLQLNEPLAEALSLAHDIGHPPFGHRGEWALNELMKPYGGFRHNAQVLRVVDLLERRNPDFPGLNLTRELRESLLKHETSEDWPEEFQPKPKHPLLEGQVTDLADSTAYNKHDIEDGLSAGMFTEADLEANVTLWNIARERVAERHPGFLQRQTSDVPLRVSRLANELIGVCIVDLCQATYRNVLDSGVTSPADVQSHDTMLCGHSPEMKPHVAELQKFLYRAFYRHPYLQSFRVWAREVIGGLFEAYRARPSEMSPWYFRWVDQVGLERAVCDFLAGMTDRFAVQEHRRLVGDVPALERPHSAMSRGLR
ncbi:Deoxyguanosinetriphosphate triphosphohydrolase [Planctomycetes bacterium Poly30]|uniref:Deoxyguanosinetriphosphate triphosphohydrolase-like protein n=1 Tax=Saltatorellus ferox TaxID=2528018 RepID=A0A518EPP5_9BACT|nr:Deoxyguanosinetriphosphate triphosphohydrolase [Planctomycetes bacterium Poly30]